MAVKQEFNKKSMTMKKKIKNLLSKPARSQVMLKLFEEFSTEKQATSGTVYFSSASLLKLSRKIALCPEVIPSTELLMLYHNQTRSSCSQRAKHTGATYEDFLWIFSSIIEHMIFEDPLTYYINWEFVENEVRNVIEGVLSTVAPSKLHKHNSQKKENSENYPHVNSISLNKSFTGQEEKDDASIYEKSQNQISSSEESCEESTIVSVEDSPMPSSEVSEINFMGQSKTSFSTLGRASFQTCRSSAEESSLSDRGSFRTCASSEKANTFHNGKNSRSCVSSTEKFNKFLVRSILLEARRKEKLTNKLNNRAEEEDKAHRNVRLSSQKINEISRRLGECNKMQFGKKNDICKETCVSRATSQTLFQPKFKRTKPMEQKDIYMRSLDQRRKHLARINAEIQRTKDLGNRRKANRKSEEYMENVLREQFYVFMMQGVFWKKLSREQFSYKLRGLGASWSLIEKAEHLLYEEPNDTIDCKQVRKFVADAVSASTKVPGNSNIVKDKDRVRLSIGNLYRRYYTISGSPGRKKSKSKRIDSPFRPKLNTKSKSIDKRRLQKLGIQESLNTRLELLARHIEKPEKEPEEMPIECSFVPDLSATRWYFDSRKRAARLSREQIQQS